MGKEAPVPTCYKSGCFVVCRFANVVSLESSNPIDEAQCQSQILPIPSRYEPDFLRTNLTGIGFLYSFKAIFFPTGRFLAFTEQHILGGELRIMVFDISIEPQLSLVLVASHSFKHRIYDIKFVAFHPRLAILAFFAASVDMGELESGAYI
jgi:hypothetical protein